jgi:hypothetical protein
MGFADLYFSKQKEFAPYFAELPSEKLRFSVVIPAYCEPDLIPALNSLLNCEPPGRDIEVIVVLNMPENADQALIENTRKTAEAVSAWMKVHTSSKFRFLLIKELMMPVKDAGVGFARKQGMDQALYRFSYRNNPGGFILSFDADSRCESNYFTSIEDTLERYPHTRGFNVYFEHPVSGKEYPDPVYRGIIAYEMHLRYLNLSIRDTGFPFAYHTVGSCFGVRAETYASQGGMSKRKAGEDFYFLHKIIPLGDFREINNTCIIPSPRESDRVPFGTGAAITKYIASGESGIFTYDPMCFRDLRSFFTPVRTFYKMAPDELKSAVERQATPLKDYLLDIQAVDSIRKIQDNAGSPDSFVNRFFRWFDAFRIIKYLNYATRVHYSQIPVEQAVKYYLRDIGISVHPDRTDQLALLNILRVMEKSRG